MLAELALMREQQEAAAKASALAQRQAMIDAQNNAAQQSMTQSSAMANQNLLRQQEYQRAMDAAATSAASTQANAMGQAITGGGLNVNQLNQARLANLGTVAGYIPPGATISKTQQTEVAPTKMGNAFGIPSVEGLTFGGS
jgi:hypothetical protein